MTDPREVAEWLQKRLPFLDIKEDVGRDILSQRRGSLRAVSLWTRGVLWLVDSCPWEERLGIRGDTWKILIEHLERVCALLGVGFTWAMWRPASSDLSWGSDCASRLRDSRARAFKRPTFLPASSTVTPTLGDDPERRWPSLFVDRSRSLDHRGFDDVILSPPSLVASSGSAVCAWTWPGAYLRFQLSHLIRHIDQARYLTKKVQFTLPHRNLVMETLKRLSV
jgi:hypothetical protein